jgi:hypothetical protein
MLRISARCSVPWDYPTFGSEEITMAPENTGTSSLESVNAIYAQRVDNLVAAEDQVRDEQVEADDGFDHSESPMVEEQRFVDNPADLRKEVSSEEEFSEGLTDGEQDLGLDGTDADPEADGPDADPEADGPGEDQGPPRKSWTKAEIVDYLDSAGIGVERDDLEAMTKDELLDRYVDNS